jgi:DNA polymerase I-like protein with 3'-5' exonuclease and polymerase domains
MLSREGVAGLGSYRLWIYNGLDCCVTSEVYQEISKHITANGQHTYDFSRALQAPVLETMLRGITVNMPARADMLQKYQSRETQLRLQLDFLAKAAWGKSLNPASPKQLQAFFYAHLNLPEQHIFVKGKRKVSTNRDSLERLRPYFYALPFINHILAIRDAAKMRSTLASAVDEDNRMRFSLSIAGTETGRFSSYKNYRRTGMNGQNITEGLRQIFEADPGKKLAYFDLEQAESRITGLMAWLVSGKSTYLDACDSGDLHTTVTKLIWPGLGWTGNAKEDKALAESPFYRHYSYRDMSKRGGHGTNYYGKPPTMAKHLNVDVNLVELFQQKYFDEFPEIAEYHLWVADQLQREQRLVTPFRRERVFFGRSWDEATLRKAIAFIPQSSIADMLNRGMLLVWKLHLIELLLQVHDAILFQYDPACEQETLAKVAEAMDNQDRSQGSGFHCSDRDENRLELGQIPRRRKPRRDAQIQWQRHQKPTHANSAHWCRGSLTTHNSARVLMSFGGGQH